MTRALTCVVADRHRGVREALAALLEHEGFVVVGAAATGEHALELLRRERPDIAVLDLALPGKAAIEIARDLGPPTAIIVHAGHLRRRDVRDAFAAGIRAVVLKRVPPSELLNALAAVTRGACYIDPEFADSTESCTFP